MCARCGGTTPCLRGHCENRFWCIRRICSSETVEGKKQVSAVTSTLDAWLAHVAQDDGVKGGTLLYWRGRNKERDTNRWTSLENMSYETKCIELKVPSHCMLLAGKRFSEWWSPLSTNCPKRGKWIRLTLQMLHSIFSGEWGGLARSCSRTVDSD